MICRIHDGYYVAPPFHEESASMLSSYPEHASAGFISSLLGQPYILCEMSRHEYFFRTFVQFLFKEKNVESNTYFRELF